LASLRKCVVRVDAYTIELAPDDTVRLRVSELTSLGGHNLPLKGEPAALNDLEDARALSRALRAAMPRYDAHGRWQASSG
jgi:L-alanine-DL-glutamate epimerase-like enolase superfamily enzyme